MRLTAAQIDPGCGVLVASAAGDAVGAGYEFGSAVISGAPRIIGGGLGGFAPGEWTDDTAHSVAIARVVAGRIRERYLVFTPVSHMLTEDDPRRTK